MPYCQLYYHLVWATKNRQPLLTAVVEPVIHNYVRTKAIGLGATVFAVNGIEDHIHMVASIPAKIAVSTFIGQVKAVASTKFNKSNHDHPAFFWQEEYGAFTFDRKRLPHYIGYVERQKEHHAQQTTIPILERTGHNTSLSHEGQETYLTDDESWRRELESWE